MDERVNILLVDDEPRNLDALEAILDPDGHRFVRAHSANEALLSLLHGEFAAIVLDIKMPGVSGLELASIIKGRKKTEHIPILFLTAHLVEERDVLQGYGAGAVDYLQKPINPEILRSKISVFVDLFRKTRALAAANQALAAEVVQRQRAQEELYRANEDLEARVQERTANLMIANAALRDSEERFRTMAETVPDIIFTNLAGGECDYLNARFYEFTGMAIGSGNGYGWAAALHADDARRLRWELRRRVRQGESFEVEHRLRGAGGEFRWFRSSVRPIRDHASRVVKWFGACTDIHDLKMTQAELSRQQARLEEQVAERTEALVLSQRRLAQQERLAALGTLATGLGHDMSNLLLPVRARLESLATGSLTSEEGADVAAIREAVGYLQRLSSALRLLAVDPERASETEGATDLASWWRDVEGLFRAAAPRGVSLKGHCPPGLPPLAISASRLTQIVFNLVQNAGEALTSGMRAAAVPQGTITITAAAAGPDHDAGEGRARADDRYSGPSSVVVLTVADDGPGMPVEVAARCFEPYFSTKVRAVSTGMGLPMVRAWVEAAGGCVRLTTAPGKGAVFSLYLPAAAAQQPVRALGPAAKPRLAITLTDPRISGFAAAIAAESGAMVVSWDGDAPPDSDVWVVGGAASAPERIAAFIGAGPNRRAVVMAEAGALTRHAQSVRADHGVAQRVWYQGRQPTIGNLRQAIHDSLRSLVAPTYVHITSAGVTVDSGTIPAAMHGGQEIQPPCSP